MAKQRLSVEQFIATGKSSGGAGTEIEFSEFYTGSGVGGGKWRKTGVTGQTPSQLPGDYFVSSGKGGYAVDSNGDEWVIKPIMGQVTQMQMGAVGDNSTYDENSFNSLYAGAVELGYAVWHERRNHVLGGRLVITRPIRIDSDMRCAMRWDSPDPSLIGVLCDFEEPTDTLNELRFPRLIGPATNSLFSIPGYGSGLQDPTTRIGTAIELRGGNRLTLYAHIMNGFENAFFVKSTANSTSDNINLESHTSDFCENWVRLNSNEGFGLGSVVAKGNTVWAKRPVLLEATTGYIYGCRVDIKGSALINEIGGCGIYTRGNRCIANNIYINRLESGWRDDSTLDSPMILYPTSTMNAVPVDGETITQANSGATGIVATNAEYTDTDSSPITVIHVEGAFNTTDELTGSVSGALGAGSVPTEVRGFVAPLIGGEGSCNGLTFDGDPLGEIGYFEGRHCDITIGMAMDNPVGRSDGAHSAFPVQGETLRLLDNGFHNKINIINKYVSGATEIAPLGLSSITGEENFNGGTGSAEYADCVYCSVDVSSLAPGSSTDFFIYHCKATKNFTNLPVQVIPKNESIATNNLEVIAYYSATVDSRRVKVRVYNRGDTPVTAEVVFYLRFG